MVESNTQIQLSEVLIQSMCGPLMSKVKLLLHTAQKNRLLAAHEDLRSLIDLIAEQLLPQYCIRNINDYKVINEMHNLCYLLASKLQSVFNSGIIRTCIDQNWDLKGLRAVLLRILERMQITGTDILTSLLDKVVQSQNLQSQACIKAISYFLKSVNKPIEEDDLLNPISSYQAGFDFLKKDITQFRGQKMKYECFTVLHPWAYDLDNVDFKYVVNKDHVKEIHRILNDTEATVFWLTFFKSQLSCTADEFYNAIRELGHINLVSDHFEDNLSEYKQNIIRFEGVISLKQHSEFIKESIHTVIQYGQQKHGFSALVEQIRFKSDERQPTKLISEDKIRHFELVENPALRCFSENKNLSKMKIHQATTNISAGSFEKFSFEIRPTQAVANKLSLKFINVDTDELKDTEINFDGNLAFFKVGEGDNNHFQIANDKKLWESQFMIVCKNGKFFIRDLGVVHTSRIKVEKNIELQLQQGTMIDLGKVVHYHFDKVTHKARPTANSSDNFIIMRPNQDYVVESDDDSVLRGRQNWVSGDENKDMAQNEILISADEQKKQFSVGRSIRRDIEIKLKAVSADHCTIQYSNEKGWIIHENGKDKLSSNGTFVFMKSMSQMDNHEPSDMIPLTNGMIISFINYELQVRIEAKGPGEPQLFEHQENKVEAPKPKGKGKPNHEQSQPLVNQNDNLKSEVDLQHSATDNLSHSSQQPQVQSHREEKKEFEEFSEDIHQKSQASIKSPLEVEENEKQNNQHENEEVENKDEIEQLRIQQEEANRQRELQQQKEQEEEKEELERQEQLKLKAEEDKRKKKQEEEEKRKHEDELRKQAEKEEEEQEKQRQAELQERQKEQEEKERKEHEQNELRKQKEEEEEQMRQKQQAEHEDKLRQEQQAEKEELLRKQHEIELKAKAEEEERKKREQQQHKEKEEEEQRKIEEEKKLEQDHHQSPIREETAHDQTESMHEIKSLEQVNSHTDSQSKTSLHANEEKHQTQEDHKQVKVEEQKSPEKTSEHKVVDTEDKHLAGSSSAAKVSAQQEEHHEKNIVHNESAKSLEQVHDDQKDKPNQSVASLHESPSKASIKHDNAQLLAQKDHSSSQSEIKHAEHQKEHQQSPVVHKEESKHQTHVEQDAHANQATHVDVKEEHKVEASLEKGIKLDAKLNTDSHSNLIADQVQSSPVVSHQAEPELKASDAGFVNVDAIHGSQNAKSEDQKAESSQQDEQWDMLSK